MKTIGLVELSQRTRVDQNPDNAYEYRGRKPIPRVPEKDTIRKDVPEEDVDDTQATPTPPI